MILQQKLEEAIRSKTILDTSSIPRKCYMCNECQNFDSFSFEREICLVCGHYEGVHEQVSNFKVILADISIIYIQVNFIKSFFFHLHPLLIN